MGGQRERNDTAEVVISTRDSARLTEERRTSGGSPDVGYVAKTR